MPTALRLTIAVLAASAGGYAFYCFGFILAYMIRGTQRLADYDPIVMTTAFLVLPLTAGASLAINYVLIKAFGRKR